MEDILASIRRIISDDDGAKPPASAPAMAAAKATPAVSAKPAPVPEPPPPAEPAAMSQEDIDAMLAGFDSPPAEAEPAPAAKSEEPAAKSDEPADVLELTEAMEAQPEPVAFRRIEPAADVVFNDPPPPPPPMAPPVARAVPMPSPEPDAPPAHPLLSDQAQAAVSSAFGSLAHTVLVQNARTLDDLVRDMLRPMLKSWLDDNLPTIVERLVRQEIERVSRGRG